MAFFLKKHKQILKSSEYWQLNEQLTIHRLIIAPPGKLKGKKKDSGRIADSAFDFDN